MVSQRFTSFKDFYPYYLQEHSRRGTRVLHFWGTGLVLVFVGMAVAERNLTWLLGAPLAGYGFAWVSHLFIEHNRPATFRHPFYSLLGDFRLFFELLTGRQHF